MNTTRPPGSATLEHRGIKLLTKLGSGGMADVYLGLQTASDGFERFVVVKKIRPLGLPNKQALGMFLDEARTIAQLNHPHIVKIYDLGIVDGDISITMEYLDGESLAYVLSRLQKANRRLPTAVSVKLVLDALEAMSYAHSATGPDGRALHLVHRDISPQNLMLDSNGYLRVIDFGIAKTTIQTELTSPGGVKGKFAYLAPETFKDRDIDHRVDIYALGLVLWECLTMRKAFTFASDTPLHEVMQRICGEPLPKASNWNKKVPPALDDVVACAVAIDRQARYASCDDFARDLRAAAEDAVGIANAQDVRHWFQVTFRRRLANRRKFEEQSVASAREERAQQMFEDPPLTRGHDDLPKTTSGPAAHPETGNLTRPSAAQLQAPIDPDASRSEVATPTLTEAPPPAAPAPARSRRGLAAALALLVFVGAAGAAYWVSRRDPGAARANLLVESTPAGALVEVDGEVKGVTPEGAAFEVVLDEGAPASLVLRRDGHEDFSQQVTAREGEVVRIAAHLVPTAAPAPDPGPAAADVTDDGDDDDNKNDADRDQDPDDAHDKDHDDDRTNAKVARHTPSRPVRQKPTPKPHRPEARTVSDDVDDDDGDHNTKKPAPPDEPPPQPVAKPAPSPAPAPKKPAPAPDKAPDVKVAATPAKPAPAAPQNQWLSKSGRWPGDRVLTRGCTRCHNAKRAPQLRLGALSPRQWERFFVRDQHARHVDLDIYFSDGEQRRALAAIVRRIEKSKAAGVSGTR